MLLSLARFVAVALCVGAAVSAASSLAADTHGFIELPARTGAEFEQDGIKLVLTIAKPQVSLGQPLAFEVVIENRSKQDRTLLHPPTLMHHWKMTATDATGQVWQVIPPPLAAAAAPPESPVVIKAGEKHQIPFKLGEHYRFRRQGGGDGAFPLIEHLPNGKYTLTVKRTFHGATKNVELANKPPLWVAEVVLDRAVFTTTFEKK
jgi:hypothetical protein